MILCFSYTQSGSWLISACEKGDLNTVRRLSSQVVVRDVRGSDGRSLLHIAARLVIVSMQYATLDNAQHNGPFKLCAG